MVCIRFVQPNGVAREIDAQGGETLMAGAKANGIDGIEAECGGSMVCGTCHVYVDEPWFTLLGSPLEMEAEMLEYSLYPQPNSRLSCQIRVTEDLAGMSVAVPVSQR